VDTKSIETGADSVKRAYTAVIASVSGLVDDLLALERDVGKEHTTQPQPSTWHGRKRKRSSTSSSEEDGNGITEDEELLAQLNGDNNNNDNDNGDDDSASATTTPRRDPTVKDYWRHITGRWQPMLKWHQSNIDKWNQRTQLASGSTAMMSKNFKVINQVILI
jgi:hypothetical protein